MPPESWRRGLSMVELALGPATLSGVAVETDAGGHAVQVAPVRLGGGLAEAQPGFWE